MSCKTINRPPARAEVRPRATPQWIRHEGVLYRQVTGAELRGQFKGLRAARSPASQRKARAQARAAALGRARQPRPKAVAAPASTGPAAASTSEGDSSSCSGESGSGDDDDIAKAGDEPALDRSEPVLALAVGSGLS
jgi:hypothetical protein